MRGVGIWAVVRTAAATASAAARSGASNSEILRPGAMHLERLTARWVRSGISTAIGWTLAGTGTIALVAAGWARVWRYGDERRATD